MPAPLEAVPRHIGAQEFEKGTGPNSARNHFSPALVDGHWCHRFSLSNPTRVAVSITVTARQRASLIH